MTAFLAGTDLLSDTRGPGSAGSVLGAALTGDQHSGQPGINLLSCWLVFGKLKKNDVF